MKRSQDEKKFNILKPIKTAARDYGRHCDIDHWWIANSELASDAYTQETGIVLSDGGRQTGVYNPDIAVYAR